MSSRLARTIAHPIFSLVPFALIFGGVAHGCNDRHREAAAPAVTVLAEKACDVAVLLESGLPPGLCSLIGDLGPVVERVLATNQAEIVAVGEEQPGPMTSHGPRLGK